MVKTATIREQLESYLHEHVMTINRFADISGVNSGTLSNIINGNRPISMQQLDRITMGMNLPEGSFYDLYIEECIFHTTPDWRRLGPFLQRCAELNRLDCLDKAINLTMDNISYIPQLFETAETFFKEGKNEAAILIYKSVAESERFQHSERLALCQYRLFTLGLSDDQDANSQAAVHFEPFVDRLEERYQLDALVKLLNVFISLARWKKVDTISEKLCDKAKILYKLKKGHPTLTAGLGPKNPLIFYILYSYLTQEHSCSERGDHEKALYYLSLYEAPDWINPVTIDERKILDQFHEWSIANKFQHQLLNGQIEVLSEYEEFIASRENEVFSAVCNIIIAANLYGINVDHILDRFKEHLTYKEQRYSMLNVNKHVVLNSFTRLQAELGVYYLNSNNIVKGIDYVLESLKYSIIINSNTGMLRSMGLFEKYRHLSSDESQSKYKKMVNEVHKLNEKKIGLSASYM
ncbi:helix-turn-helix transcriptional regulator [Paenibacillus sp. JCM 10914]|uniref:helix-turn-helix domain-containing protein n=1 Tax=Paenibacillus sp. JCM 10914 TaxID=1236974 RepID=UPI0003CC5F1C|nr:helix-turn-helix transcriptional regulator [Paenibacillus sp. JCM 10914]GAE04943.1 hypothetical protein JCM10914_1020 [Paenibacillus sp. JCM 10914]